MDQHEAQRCGGEHQGRSDAVSGRAEHRTEDEQHGGWRERLRCGPQTKRCPIPEPDARPYGDRSYDLEADQHRCRCHDHAEAAPCSANGSVECVPRVERREPDHRRGTEEEPHDEHGAGEHRDQRDEGRGHAPASTRGGQRMAGNREDDEREGERRISVEAGETEDRGDRQQAEGHLRHDHR